MKITILGYYGGYPSKNTGTTGYLVQTKDTNLLLDAGSATLLELEKHLDPLDLDCGFTHALSSRSYSRSRCFTVPLAIE